jgi:DnaK suppressor protein
MNMAVTNQPGAMNGLDRHQVQRLRARLEEEREAIWQRLRARRARVAEQAGREPDEGDWAASSADQSLTVRLVDRDSRLLQEIDRALARMRAGTYGIGEQSQEPVGFDRLWARPWARDEVGKDDTDRGDREDPEDEPAPGSAQLAPASTVDT